MAVNGFVQFGKDKFMSRIGKKPVPLVDKVKVALKDRTLTISGPLGNLNLVIPSELSLDVSDKVLNLKRASDDRRGRELHGLYRSLIHNMVVGVSHGYTRVLDIVGVGYKAELKGRNLEMALGFSHPIVYPIPEGIKVVVDKGARVTITGADKHLIGEVASQLRRFRPPEPYKGKGVRYSDEVVRKKVGKAATAVGGGGK